MNILRNTLLSSATVVLLAFTSVPLASASEPTHNRIENVQALPEILTVVPSLDVTASKSVKIDFSTPVITSAPAPVPEPVPVVLAQEVVPLVETIPAPAPAPAPVYVEQVPVVEVAPAPAPEPVVVSAPVQAPASGVGGALAGSAYAQLGIAQDCTRMVENALGSIGIITGDIAPEHFFQYGQIVSDPQPGDLMIQPGHVAIYVGNGMAISGGFEGMNTVLHPASYLGGSVFVRVG